MPQESERSNIAIEMMKIILPMYLRMKIKYLFSKCFTII